MPCGAKTLFTPQGSRPSRRTKFDPLSRYTADQLGHEDPRVTPRAYAQANRRCDWLAGPHLRAYDAALETNGH